MAIAPPVSYFRAMLNLTKIAFGCDSVAMLAERLAFREQEGGGRFHLPTRYRPTRWREIEGGSLFWIVRHQIVGRSPIVEFADRPDGRVDIVLDPRLIAVAPWPRRAHQGWRYLEAQDAPRDLDAGQADALASMPAALRTRLTELALI